MIPIQLFIHGQLPVVQRPRTLRSLAFVFAALVVSPAAALADSWAYPSEDLSVQSDNHLYRFTAYFPQFDASRASYHTLPPAGQNGTPVPERGDKCIGVLEKLEGGRSRVVWRKQLVNPVLPLDALVTNDGRFVVTFDNWFGVGTDPIVIYGRKGQLVKRHSLDSLHLRKWRHEDLIKSSISSIYWNEDAVHFLNHASDKLIIRLYWGHLFAVRLRDGEVFERDRLQNEYADIRATIRARAKDALWSQQASDRKLGALIAGYDGFPEFVPRLRELLADPEFNTSYSLSERYEGTHRMYFVREAAKNALARLGEKNIQVITEDVFDNPDDRKTVEQMNARRRPDGTYREKDELEK